MVYSMSKSMHFAQKKNSKGCFCDFGFFTYSSLVKREGNLDPQSALSGSKFPKKGFNCKIVNAGFKDIILILTPPNHHKSTI